MDLVPASAPHWHLVLNHFPSVGTLVAVCLLAGASFTRSRDLTRASLLLFVVLGLLAIPVFVSGGAAGVAIQETPEFSAPALAAHQDAAVVATSALFVTSWLAWFLLLRERRRPTLDTAAPLLVLAAGGVSVLLMLRTAGLGGYINHPEIHTTAIAEQEGGVSAAIINWVFATVWAWPSMEAIHFLGMALLFGAVLLTTLRVLGVAKAIPYAAVHRLLPLGAFGLALNIVTGMVFFMVDVGRYSLMIYGFFPKMTLIVVGGVAVVYFTVFDGPWKLKAGDEPPGAARAMAAATLVVWLLVVAFGRLLPYIPGA